MKIQGEQGFHVITDKDLSNITPNPEKMNLIELLRTSGMTQLEIMQLEIKFGSLL